MKITLVADVYGQTNNGTSLSAKRFVDMMRNRGHTVKVVSTFSGDSSDYYKVKRRKFGVLDYYITNKNGVLLGKPQKNVLKEAIIDADIVHFLLPFKMSKCGIKICLENNIPYTTAFHCPPEMISMKFPFCEKVLTNILYKYYNKSFYKYTNFVHCPSQMISNKLVENNYKTKNYIISNGVLEDFKCNRTKKPKRLQDKFCILSIGRLSFEKYHKTIIDAVKLSKYKDKIQLIFAGSGPFRDKLVKWSKDLTNPPIIKFMNKETLINTINYCDLFVHASKVEIEGMGCLEAMSCGLVPVLSNSKNAAISQFALSEKNLFEFNNPKDLASKIDYWIENPKEKEKMQKNYIEYMKKFTIDECMKKMEQMFNDAICYYKK